MRTIIAYFFFASLIYQTEALAQEPIYFTRTYSNPVQLDMKASFGLNTVDEINVDRIRADCRKCEVKISYHDPDTYDFNHDAGLLFGKVAGNEFREGNTNLESWTNDKFVHMNYDNLYGSSDDKNFTLQPGSASSKRWKANFLAYSMQLLKRHLAVVGEAKPMSEFIALPFAQELWGVAVQTSYERDAPTLAIMRVTINDDEPYDSVQLENNSILEAVRLFGYQSTEAKMAPQHRAPKTKGNQISRANFITPADVSLLDEGWENEDHYPQELLFPGDNHDYVSTTGVRKYEASYEKSDNSFKQTLVFYLRAADYPTGGDAEAVARKCAKIVGQLPRILRFGIKAFYIVKKGPGVVPYNQSNNVIMNMGYGAIVGENEGYIEETFLHEAGHSLSLRDYERSVITDGRSFTVYGLDSLKTGEDAPEHFAHYLFTNFRTDRPAIPNTQISEELDMDMLSEYRDMAPNRLMYFANKLVTKYNNYQIDALKRIVEFPALDHFEAMEKIMYPLSLEPGAAGGRKNLYTNEEVEEPDFQLYPNPVKNGLVTLHLFLTRRSAIDIRIVDVNGNTLIYSQNEGVVGRQTITVSTAGLAQGIYFVHVRGASLNKVEKLLVY